MIGVFFAFTALFLKWEFIILNFNLYFSCQIKYSTRSMSNCFVFEGFSCEHGAFYICAF